MPVVAVAAGMSSFVAGATALTAATTTMATIAAGASMVGGALSMIGAVSGNKKLAALGGLVALGGGLAGGMSNPFGGGDQAAGSAAQGVADVADAAAGANATADAWANGAGLGQDVVSGMEGAAAASGPSSILDMAPGQQTLGSVDTMTSAPMSQMGQQATRSTVAPMPADAVPAPSASAGGMESAAAAPSKSAFQADTTSAFKPAETVSAGTTAAADKGLMDKFQSWAKANPELAKMALESAKGFVGNLVPSDLEKARLAQINQQTADAKRKALWATGRIN